MFVYSIVIIFSLLRFSFVFIVFIALLVYYPIDTIVSMIILIALFVALFELEKKNNNNNNNTVDGTSE